MKRKIDKRKRARAARRWESPKDPPLLLQWWGQQLHRDEIIAVMHEVWRERQRRLERAAARWEDPPLEGIWHWATHA